MEAQQFQRNLTLVVVHADGTVVLAVAYFQVQSVGWERALASNLRGLRALDGRADDINFLATNGTAVPRVGIERGNRNAGAAKAGTL